MGNLLASTVNLSLLIGLLWYHLKSPLRLWVCQRSENQQSAFKIAYEQLKQAQESDHEFLQKLAQVDTEIVFLKKQMQQEALQIKEKILAQATEAVHRAREGAKNTVENGFRQLKIQMMTEMTTHILTQTQVLLQQQLKTDDHLRLQKKFSQQIEGYS